MNSRKPLRSWKNILPVESSPLPVAGRGCQPAFNERSIHRDGYGARTFKSFGQHTFFTHLNRPAVYVFLTLTMTKHTELLNAIERELTQLGYRWAIFCQLFDSGQDNVDLLNKSGSNVFLLFQKLIIDDVMMSLCRLSDPPKSMGYENASLRNLVGKLEEELPQESRKTIETKLTELTQHLVQVTTLRNKSLSHTDLSHALNTELLPRPTYDELERAIQAATCILNEITGAIFNYNSDYIPLLPFGCDGNKLLSVLAMAYESRRSGD